MSANHDALREALNARLRAAMQDDEHSHGYRAGVRDCLNDLNALSKPQAQAGEPEVVKHQFQLGSGTWVDFENAEHFKRVKESGAWPVRELITLQSHREAMAAKEQKIRGHIADVLFLQEAIAKKDAALDACVEALEFFKAQATFGPSVELADAAITKAQEART